MVQFGLSRVCAAGYKVIYDSSGGNKFTVNKPDGIQMQFSQSAQGLFYIDTKETGMVFINTVADNRSKYTNRDYSRAELARKIQNTIGRPSTRTFLHIVDNNLLQNCPITRKDILAAEHIFGPDVRSVYFTRGYLHTFGFLVSFDVLPSIFDFVKFPFSF